ncbi:helix-turn-helix domain-containing protein [uncultured Flavonifractor sp.]|uniref:helix-turn-helix domain-containing protein n=1 Tax=uncultured Flavonifractor sp. TaxID=1193534 RepID=UPI00262C2179|nr:helix-turn-helix domain-containing protein [uncultured Flavonifractor sp.]
MNEILTVKEAAALLKTSRQQIRRMIQNGELPAVKVGREWRISKNALLDYLGFPY